MTARPAAAPLDAPSHVPSDAPPARPLLTIRPSRGWAVVDVREVWEFRDLLVSLAGRDLKIRYKQTVLGVLWVVLLPLTAAGIFAFVFGGVAKLETPGGVPYFLFTFTGLLAWNLFNGTLGRASSVMVGNEHLVSKVYFPRLILPLSTVSTGLIDLAVASGMLIILLIAFWHLPGVEILLLPVCLTLLLMLSLGAGMAATALAVSYRDIGYILPVLLQLLLYLSPIAYPLAEVPERFRAIYSLNPLVPLLEAFRWSVLGVGTVPWGGLAYAAVVSLLVLVGGALVFRRMERRFADVI